MAGWLYVIPSSEIHAKGGPMEVMVVEGEISYCKRMKMFRIYEPFISRNTGRPEMENRGEGAIKTEKEQILVFSKVPLGTEVRPVDSEEIICELLHQ